MVEIFDETETVIIKKLEELVAKLKEKDKVFVWYSGHGYGCQDGQHKGYTLLIPKAEQFGSYLSDDEGEDLGDTVNGRLPFLGLIFLFPSSPIRTVFLDRV